MPRVVTKFSMPNVALFWTKKDLNEAATTRKDNFFNCLDFAGVEAKKVSPKAVLKVSMSFMPEGMIELAMTLRTSRVELYSFSPAAIALAQNIIRARMDPTVVVTKPPPTIVDVPKAPVAPEPVLDEPAMDSESEVADESEDSVTEDQPLSVEPESRPPSPTPSLSVDSPPEVTPRDDNVSPPVDQPEEPLITAFDESPDNSSEKPEYTEVNGDDDDSPYDEFETVRKEPIPTASSIMHGDVGQGGDKEGNADDSPVESSKPKKRTVGKWTAATAATVLYGAALTFIFRTG